MRIRKTWRVYVLGAGCGFALTCAHAVMAQVPTELPGAADAGRVRSEQRLLAPEGEIRQREIVPPAPLAVPIPAGADQIAFDLQGVVIEGATVFSQNELRDIYAAYLGKTITLDIAYRMAGALTERYRNAGYFLSIASVPNQSIEGGVLRLKVTEGYVGDVVVHHEVGSHFVIRGYIERLKARRPVKASEIESFLLRLNDLPGYNFESVLSAIERGPEGAVRLTLKVDPKKATGQIGLDNHGSRYLGPAQVSASYSASLLPLHQTNISTLSSVPFKKLNTGSLSHSVVVLPDVTFTMMGSYTQAEPGFSLQQYDVQSESVFLSGSLRYQWLRQRQYGLAFRLSVDSRNSDSDILKTALTRDHIRAMRFGVDAEFIDSFYGSNTLNMTFSKGIDGLGANRKTDINLSRAQARADFTKIEAAFSRLQGITEHWSVLTSVAGQWAPKPLFSSEEFGYGGQSFGRAYDVSELTGDHGLAGSVELRYSGWADFKPVGISPYAFYDIGAIWNEDIGNTGRQSGASTGFGVRAETVSGLSANLGIAWPLVRDIGTPLYNDNPKSPRLLLQLQQAF